VPAFEDGTWFFVTGSYTGQLTMSNPGDAFDWLHYWEAYKSALQSLVGSGDVRGVFWTEELAVNSMFPVKVLPHVHCVIEADGVDEDVQAKLNQLVTQHLAGVLEEHLMPNLRIARISSDRSLFHHIRYTVKPIKLLKAYDLAWLRAVAHNRHWAQQLNSQFTDLVLGYSQVTTDRDKINTKGNLKPGTKNFIGVLVRNHDEHQELLQRISEGPHEYIEMEADEEVSLSE
jgi:hypothetical protein